ncbi:MAG: aminotransferase class III-fold pyridoxal phosphate-dependent enzyme, partial [Bacteroidota bacterium]|nr:aminotransferase class III-fold pyridoxal phosphate-dependent enzyme [Bacteroidota bacterium]
AQELYNITPDLTTLGKIIGGGLPVGAYGGRREIMDFISPAGPIYQAGTLSGNPLAMAAGLALLRELKANPAIYRDLNEVSDIIVNGLRDQLASRKLPFSVNQVGSMFTLFFSGQVITDYDTAKTSDTTLFGKYFNAMLQRGIYLAPSQFEAVFVSHAITKDIAVRILEASEGALTEILS